MIGACLSGLLSYISFSAITSEFILRWSRPLTRLFQRIGGAKVISSTRAERSMSTSPDNDPSAHTPGKNKGPINNLTMRVDQLIRWDDTRNLDSSLQWFQGHWIGRLDITFLLDNWRFYYVIALGKLIVRTKLCTREII